MTHRDVFVTLQSPKCRRISFPEQFSIVITTGVFLATTGGTVILSAENKNVSVREFRSITLKLTTDSWRPV